MASVDVFESNCIAVYDGSHCKDVHNVGGGSMHIPSPDMTPHVRLVPLQVKVRCTGTGPFLFARAGSHLCVRFTVLSPLVC